jgi:hypothetical protein
VRFGLFEAFKYAIYLLLGMDILLFFQEEWLASDHTFAGGVSGLDVLAAYAATIDTAAWWVLLVLFELETSTLRKGRSGAAILAIHVSTAVCYAFILTSFWGYLAKLDLVLSYASTLVDPCSPVAAGNSLAIDFDEYIPLGVEQCGSLIGQALVKLGDLAIYASESAAAAQQWLAWIDVVNAGAWLAVVAVLAVDVFLQQRGLLRGGILALSKACKLVLYGTLLGAAIYWGIWGDFVDGWDAVLWLLAFALIEMNLLSWHAEAEVATRGADAG